MKISDLPIPPPKVLVYGPPGSGKTALCGTLGARSQCIDLNQGLSTCKLLKDKFTLDRNAVDVVQFLETERYKGKASVFDKTKKYVKDVVDQCHKGTYPFDALWLDGLTDLAEASLFQVLSNNGTPFAQPEIQHWGLAFIEIKLVVSLLKALPIPVFLIAHDQRDTIGSALTKRDVIELAVQGKNLPAQIAAAMDEMWYMHAVPAGAGTFKYAIQTKANGLVPAKSRLQLPDMLDTKDGMWAILAQAGYKPKEPAK